MNQLPSGRWGAQGISLLKELYFWREAGLRGLG